MGGTVNYSRIQSAKKVEGDVFCKGVEISINMPEKLYRNTKHSVFVVSRGNLRI